MRVLKRSLGNVRCFAAVMIMAFGSGVIALEANSEQRICEQAECGLNLQTESGEFFSAPMLNTNVSVTVTGVALRAVITQRFENPGDDWVEGVYSFPVPMGAAVNELRMRIGDRVIVGEIREREQAERQYQKAKQSGRKASLIKAHRPNLFTTKVANLGPREIVEIEIAYFQELPITIAEQQIRLPLVVGPRYTPAPEAERAFTPADESLPMIPTRSAANGKHNPVAIEVSLNLGVPLKILRSLYHDVDIDQQATRYQVKLANKHTPANRDFVLEFAPGAADQATTAILSEQSGDLQYGLMMVMPPQGDAQTQLRREVTFILDRSGSMSGTSIEQAKAALLLALDRLSAGDQFNVIQFNSGSGQLFAAPTAVTPESIQAAKRYVAGLSANGGTEMMGALQRAFNAPASADFLQQVIFITDGNVSNETVLFNYIEENLTARRLFSIGIGSAPNHYFLQRAAAAGKGFHTAIGDLREVELRMTALFNKLQKPLLRDIEISVDGSNVEYWPRVIPDLYAGEPVAVAFRAPRGELSIRAAGKLPDQHWHAELTLNGGQQRQGLAELFGQRKIDSLMTTYRRAAGDPERQAALRANVIETALDSHLVSKFTSLVAVDKTPSNLSGEQNRSKNIPRNLPHGWRLGTSQARLPQTATSADLRITLGLLLFAIMFGYYALWQRRGLMPK